MSIWRNLIKFCFQDAEEELDIDLTDPDLHKAATKIQASFRGHKVRKEEPTADEKKADGGQWSYRVTHLFPATLVIIIYYITMSLVSWADLPTSTFCMSSLSGQRE